MFLIDIDFISKMLKMFLDRSPGFSALVFPNNSKAMNSQLLKFPQIKFVEMILDCSWFFKYPRTNQLFYNVVVFKNTSLVSIK